MCSCVVWKGSLKLRLIPRVSNNISTWLHLLLSPNVLYLGEGPWSYGDDRSLQKVAFLDDEFLRRRSSHHASVLQHWFSHDAWKTAVDASETDGSLQVLRWRNESGNIHHSNLWKPWDKKEMFWPFIKWSVSVPKLRRWTNRGEKYLA